MKNKLLTFLLGATAISSSMTGEAFATNNYRGGVAVQRAPSMVFPKEVFAFNNNALIERQIADIVTAFEVQRDFNIYMAEQRKALEGFAAKKEQITEDELLARHLQSQYDAEFARSLAAQDGLARHEVALEDFAVKNEQIKDDELLARHLQSQYDAEFARHLQDQYDAEFSYSLDNVEVEQEDVIAPVEKADPRSDLMSAIKGFDEANLKKVVQSVEKADPRSDLMSAIKGFDASNLKKAVQSVEKADPRSDLMSAIKGFDASNLKKAVKSVEKADPRSDLMSAIKGFDASNLKKAVKSVEKAEPRSDLMSAIKGFDASNLKKAVKSVVEAERRPLPTLPTTLKKVEKAPQRLQEEVVPVQRDVRIEPVVEEATTIMDVLARQISGLSLDGVEETLQTAEEAISALRLAMTEGDIDDLDNNACKLVEKALKTDSNKLSWFVSEFYDENDGWDFGFFEGDDVVTKMTKVSPKEEDLVEDKTLSQQRGGSVKKLSLNVDSGLSLLEQIRLARGVVEAEEDRGFVKAPVISVVEEVEEMPVVVRSVPAKKVVVKVLDEESNSGNLLSAIAGFNLANLKKVETTEDPVEEVEKVETLNSRLINALGARRGAIEVDSDDEDESWDDF